MADAAGVLLRVYGLKPWELDRLTGHELKAVVGDYEKLTDGGS